MKLFAKYSRINLIASIVIFMVASVAFYFTLRLVFIHQIDEDLRIEEEEILTFVHKHDRLPESISVGDQLIHFANDAGSFKTFFDTRNLVAPDENKLERFREIVFPVTAAGSHYRVTVSKSLEDTDSLTHTILVIALATIVLLLLVAFVINRVLLKRLWRPFYRSLGQAGEFKLDGKQALELQASGVDEFDFMNRILFDVTNKARLDYLSLKTFSENASHEIQTPLAVIRSKLDLMIQDESLSEQQHEALQAAYDAVRKLNRLNHSLLLLAKIENTQFSERQALRLDAAVQKKLDDFHELWLSKDLHVEAQLQPCTVLMNPELLEILLNNLLANATIHNRPAGRIVVATDAAGLVVANTGVDEALPEAQLYQRFARASSEGNGLGLSIIKQICDTSGLRVRYSFVNDLHSFELRVE